MLVLSITLIHIERKIIMRKEFTLTVDGRELATILAALRFHQDENLRTGPDIPDKAIEEIATDCGSLKPLNFEDVGRLCERMNVRDEPCAHRHRRIWVLVTTDKASVIHARAYNSKSLAEKAMLKYLRDHWGYEGQDSVTEAREWIAGHCSSLRLESCSVSVDCCADLENQTDSRCNWCGNAIEAEDIKWRGVCFCSDTCLDECRAAQ